MRADGHVRLQRETLAAKVPGATASFWVLKLITTAMGEAASDYLLNAIGLLGLVLGSAGFAIALWVQLRTRRYNAFAYFRRRYRGQVIGVRPTQTSQFVDSAIVPLDLEDRAGVQELFAAHRFGSVLNCAGNCALKSCELDPSMAHVLNGSEHRWGARVRADIPVCAGGGAGCCALSPQESQFERRTRDV